MRTKIVRAVCVVATAALLVLLATTSAQAGSGSGTVSASGVATVADTAAAARGGQQERRLSVPGAYGIGLYGVTGDTNYIQGYIHDTAGDGKCAELWLDFQTFPHEHFDALMTVACGHERSGWGFKDTSTDWRINGFRVAVCTSGELGAGRVCQDQNGTRVSWPIRSYNAGTYLLSEVGTN
jgi:hypothetical protein